MKNHQASGTGGTPEDFARMLRAAGLRPTRQRIALAGLLFGAGERHVCAEALHREALANRIPVSLATVYNALHRFARAGLIRAIAIDTSKTRFDTNTGDHHHFFLEQSREIVDMPSGFVRVSDLPPPPEGMEISRVDVIVRLRPSERQADADAPLNE